MYNEIIDFNQKVTSAIAVNIMNVLGCTKEDITEWTPIKDGLTNNSFSFMCKGNKYVYRDPGTGTENYISRKGEAYAMKVAKELGLDDTYIYMDQETGWKISHYIDGVRSLEYSNMEEAFTAVKMIRKLHEANVQSVKEFAIWNDTEEFVKDIQEVGRAQFEEFDELFERMKKLFLCTEEDNVSKCLCHSDCYEPNFLIGSNGKMYLIDWEYSGNADPACDLGNFLYSSGYCYEQVLAVLETYMGRELTKEELRHHLAYIAIVSYYWFVWSIYQNSHGNNVGEYLNTCYKAATFYEEKATSLYAEQVELAV